MKKEDKDALIVISSVIIFLSVLFLFMYYLGDKHNVECLDEIGEKYCLENNYTTYKNRLEYNGGDFVCLGITNQRLKETEYKGFYFLEEEWESCLSKDKKTFVKKSRGKEK